MSGAVDSGSDAAIRAALLRAGVLRPGNGAPAARREPAPRVVLRLDHLARRQIERERRAEAERWRDEEEDYEP